MEADGTHDGHPLGSKDSKRLLLTVTDVTFLLWLYAVLLICGVAYTLYWLWAGVSGPRHEFVAVGCGVAMALSGSAVYYVRKLYQACINETYNFLDASRGLTIGPSVRRVGTFAYFLFRPIFGVAFAVVTYALWRLGMAASGVVEPESGFIYVTISLGFLSGFLAGRVLTALEGYGAQRLATIMPTEKTLRDPAS